MSTGQQLGLIGNSIKVQSLPTASAETFGAGNRFYTLIGQQEGYITGHTYHTVAANDVYSWEDIAQAGPQGEDGLPALVYNDTWGFISVGLFNASTETFNRTPIVGEKVVIFSTENQYALATIESVSETTVGVRFSGPIIYTKGATGSQGPAGTTVYNNLSDIPVINQDLTASGFTPTVNTYYRHTGATTDTFTQGVIYLYDTAYHKLGESGGGGTTLNKYTVTAPSINLLRKITQNTKGRYDGVFAMNLNNVGPFEISMNSVLFENTGKICINTVLQSGVAQYYYIVSSVIEASSETMSIQALKIDASSSNFTKINPPVYRASGTYIIYYNDTEITI